MLRIGEYEREARHADLDYLWSLSIGERVRRSFAMAGRAGPYLRKPPKDLSAFYRRARELGLYRD